jgi:ubiquinone/menaquinone biosynthesis C-methylase UbiE
VPLSIYSTCIDPLLSDLRGHFISIAGMQPGDKVLDIGSGTGEQVFHYARSGMLATGIDSNPKMIKTANKLKNKYGFTISSFHLASALELPFTDDTFDFASISLVLHEREAGERDAIISEMRRVVGSKGTLVFMDFRVPLPENIPGLCIRSIEYLAGRGNYRCFRSYMREGGLRPLLEKNRLRARDERRLLSGTVSLLAAANNKN